MPLLQGQPFKLIASPDVYPIDSKIYTIQHTGEKFLKKSDYEDRLALYSQSIWTCQCTGRTGLTHKEAWMSEAKTRVAAKTAVPLALQKPLLTLVHHSLSPLEQLIDAASILCHSQFHVGEELLLLGDKQIPVRVLNSKDAPKGGFSASQPLVNGDPFEKERAAILNGNANGVSKGESPGTSPDKENQTKDPSKEDSSNKRDMLPKLYDVISFDDKKIENVSTRDLLRPYKLPSKDQLRLFIRSCALRHRGSTCTPWVVADDLVKKFNIANKLPSLFLTSPKPPLPSNKRKAQSPAVEIVKRSKQDVNAKFRKDNTTKVPPLIIKSENSPPLDSKVSPGSQNNFRTFSVKGTPQSSPANMQVGSKSFWKSITKHPLSLGKPKILPRPQNVSSQKPLVISKGAVPRKRGRPPLTPEEKERNKKLRQATLLDLSNKLGAQNGQKNDGIKLLKVKTKTEMPPPIPPTSTSYLQPSNNPLIMSPYKSPVKRATTPEAIMKLPFMRRFLHEHRTIKGVLGQFRRYAHTMDLVLTKLSMAQIEMIPEESLKLDLLTRQKKVQDKKFFENLTPEERKQYLRDKARTVALERWKERKLRNLKVEDKIVSGLISLPDPSLVETPKLIANSLFGDIVMVTDFIKCFRELLLGEEKFKITTNHLMEAITAGSQGYKVIADVMCCLLPTIIHDDISKNCKEIGVSISVIPVTYQTAHELARLSLRKQTEEEEANNIIYEENYQIGKEMNELSDELLSKLECCELWELECWEVVSVLKALVHKALCTASVSVYVEEIEEKVLHALREKRKLLKQIQKDQRAEVEKRKEERIQNRLAKGVVPKKQRGRPKGYSPKSAGSIQEFLNGKAKEPEPIVNAVQNRRLSTEISKEKKAEMQKLEKERQKQAEESQKRKAIDRKYEDIVIKRDNLVRRTPIGYDRDHNRYWIFHTTTPGLYVEKGWVDSNTDYRYTIHKPTSPSKMTPKKSPVTVEHDSSDEEKPLSIIANQNPEENEPLSTVKTKLQTEMEEPLSVVKSKLKNEMDEDNRPLATVKSKLTISPMKMACRGRPPKEAYVLVDEDTQTFPTISENTWHYYRTMEEVKQLISCLSDQGQRESQLIAALNMNKERLQYHYNQKPDALKLSSESSDRLKESLKEDIIQIERELIEGWLGGVPNFDEWEAKVKEAENVTTMGVLLMEAQKHMQIKYLKSIMAPVKEVAVSDVSDGASTECDVEGPGVERWREAVLSCRTYSRLHVLVGLFDSCIKWEKSMAMRKCRVCRSKVKDSPLAMCEKCQTSYHYYCLRPPLKDDPGETWTCPACMPKKTRREETNLPQDNVAEDLDEKDDPTYSVLQNKRQCKKKKLGISKQSEHPGKVEKECTICYGRIGLIVCSKCSAAYHSECHDPPLLSRARKDWVCGACVDPKKVKQKIKLEDHDGEKPLVRRNYFGNMEEIPSKKRGNTGPRDHLGRFLRGKQQTAQLMLVHDASQGDVVEDETEEPNMDKFGRSIRGAKAKALENITVEAKHKSGEDSRRSSRNQHKRKNYKDESEDDSDNKSDDGSGSESEETKAEGESENNNSSNSDVSDSESEEGGETELKSKDENVAETESEKSESESEDDSNEVENEEEKQSESDDDSSDEEEDDDHVSIFRNADEPIGYMMQNGNEEESDFDEEEGEQT